MSVGAPRNPAVPLRIMIFEFGSARRLPGAPPVRSTAPIDIAMPEQIVRTSGLTYCIVS